MNKKIIFPKLLTHRLIYSTYWYWMHHRCRAPLCKSSAFRTYRSSDSPERLLPHHCPPGSCLLSKSEYTVLNPLNRNFLWPLWCQHLWSQLIWVLNEEKNVDWTLLNLLLPLEVIQLELKYCLKCLPSNFANFMIYPILAHLLVD